MTAITIAPKKPTPPAPVERLAVSAREAAAMLSVSERTVYNWASEGKIESRRIGGRILYPLEPLRRFINGNTAGEQ